MSAETFRRAAALMRQRAKAAPAESPWGVLAGNRVADMSSPGVAMAVADVFPAGGSDRQRAMAEHVASWHPAVALAVADWLEVAADVDDQFGHDLAFTPALAVARAYLGDAS